LLDQLPVGLVRVPLELGPHGTCPLADACRFGPQFGVLHHFFHVAQAIRPVAELFASARERCETPLVAASFTGSRPLLALWIAKALLTIWLSATLLLATLLLTLLLLTLLLLTL